MANVLSQSEMEFLLSPRAAVPAGDADPASGGPASAVASIGIAGTGSALRSRIGPEVLGALRERHAVFAADLAARLSGLLRLPVQLALVSQERMTYAEFVSGLENPTCLNLIAAEPLSGRLLLELGATAVIPLVDRLLGGAGVPSRIVPRRPLTEIELRLLSRATDLACAALREAWNDVFELEPRVTQVAGQSRQLPFIAAGDLLVLASFDLLAGEAAGILNLCLPCAALEEHVDALCHDRRTGTGARPAGEASSGEAPSPGKGRGAKLVARLATTRLTRDEIQNLAVGDVIVTECRETEPLTVLVDGVPRFVGTAGLVQGRKGVRIERPLEASESPSSQDGPEA